ncbi:hypothetical protein CACET_c33980 [Clostridium aceticum]|uniref:Uncharacterized protein n=1 Tax=Clostridium aceticum TaxID=84022 RepID=A0A0G3WDS3_9CLOT|nr:hypothetical protein [Clostridium aceticum]AKL96841.1 hypothetical protein CACET_c33980 [Clostridium aceticum]
MIKLRNLSQLVAEFQEENVMVGALAANAVKGVKICKGWVKEYGRC